MSNKETTLNILPVNKTIVFYSPLEGKDVLVRTGTIQDESCFFHALLHGYSKDYISMDIKDRIDYVKKLRLSIAKKIDIETWENLSKGIAKISFQEKVNKILLEFYTYIQNSSKECQSRTIRKIIKKLFTDKNDIEVYTLITDMLPFDTSFEKNILLNSYKKSTGNISNCKKTIIKAATQFYNKEFDKLLSNSNEYTIGKNKISLYLKRLELLINEVLEEAENSAYTDYINNLQDSNIDINSYTVQLISDKFNRDIYFIDSNTRLPYINLSKENIKKRKSIVIMLTAGKHYEIIGKLLPGNKIIRDFDYKDPLIKTLRTYLYNPEKIHIYSPNAVPVLQKDRNTVNSSSESSSYNNINKNTSNSSSGSSDDEHKVGRNNSSSESSDDEHKVGRNNSSSQSSDDEHKVGRNNSSSESSSDYEYIKYNKKTINSSKESDDEF